MLIAWGNILLAGWKLSSIFTIYCNGKIIVGNNLVVGVGVLFLIGFDWQKFAAMVEKILRVQPNVKKLYLLIRANDHNSALERLHSYTYILTKGMPGMTVMGVEKIVE